MNNINLNIGTDYVENGLDVECGLIIWRTDNSFILLCKFCKKCFTQLGDFEIHTANFHQNIDIFMDDSQPLQNIKDEYIDPSYMDESVHTIVVKEEENFQIEANEFEMQSENDNVHFEANKQNDNKTQSVTYNPCETQKHKIVLHPGEGQDGSNTDTLKIMDILLRTHSNVKLPFVTKNDLRKFLSMNCQLALKYYENENTLNNHYRSQISRSIVQHIVDSRPNKTIARDEFKRLAQLITAVFPTEVASTYYTPRSKNTRAQGKLIQFYYNYRFALGKVGVLQRFRRRSPELLPVPEIENIDLPNSIASSSHSNLIQEDTHIGEGQDSSKTDNLNIADILLRNPANVKLPFVTKNDVRKFLRMNCQLALKYYENQNTLNNHYRSQISKSIVRHIVDSRPTKTIASDEFKRLAQLITAVFPTEVASKYYTPHSKKRRAQGKLIQFYYNYRFALGKVGVLQRFRRRSPELSSRPEIENIDSRNSIASSSHSNLIQEDTHIGEEQDGSNTDTLEIPDILMSNHANVKLSFVTKNDLHKFLSTNCQLALKYYENQNTLNNHYRTQISNSIVRHLVDSRPTKTITSDEFKRLAQLITAVFPTELASTYYTPHFKKTRAKGKLVRFYYNYRFALGKAGVLQRSKSPEIENTDSRNSTASSSHSNLIQEHSYTGEGQDGSNTDTLQIGDILLTNDEKSPFCNIFVTKNDLHKFLSMNCQLALKYYEKQNTLSNHIRTQISKSIVRHIVDSRPNKTITRDEFEGLALLITAVFPTELASTYYTPHFKKKRAQGKLIHVYYNYRFALGKAGVLQRLRSASPELLSVPKIEKTE